jgi:hypothetical protein
VQNTKTNDINGRYFIKEKEERVTNFGEYIDQLASYDTSHGLV